MKKTTMETIRLNIEIVSQMSLNESSCLHFEDFSMLKTVWTNNLFIL